MAISRPLLIVLVAAVVALAGFYATQGARNSSEVAAPVVAEPAPAPEPATGERELAQVDKPAKASRELRADATVAKAARARPTAAKGPAAVRRAIDRGQRVVLLFEAPRGADDRATARAVAAQRGTPGVVVMTEPIARLVRYRTLIGGLGISQAPAVVIVGKKGAARLVEGYVDPATLSQEVADVR